MSESKFFGTDFSQKFFRLYLLTGLGLFAQLVIQPLYAIGLFADDGAHRCEAVFVLADDLWPFGPYYNPPRATE